MSYWRRQAGVGLATALLASLLVTSLIGTALAVTVSNANPSVTVPTGTPTSVGISYVWNGTAADTTAPFTTLAVTLPSGYSWNAWPTLTATPSSTATFTGPVASNGGLTQTWTRTTFTTSSTWSIALAGGTVVTTNTSGTGPITLSVDGGAAVQIASLTASGATAGSVVPITISPTSAPANGTSTILIRFGTVTATCTNDTAFSVSTTGGTFSATSLPLVTPIPAGGSTSVTVACANFATVGGSTLTLLAPTSPRTAFITVTLALAPPATGSVVDSTTQVAFAPVTSGKGGHGTAVPAGARKVAFYAATSSATGCATAAAQPASGAPSYGFAILTSTGHGKLNVTVSLKGALHNATYSVSVEQSPGSCSVPFTVHTNGVGNGNGHVHLNAMAGATSFWVTATSGSSTLVTRAAAFSLKSGHGPTDKDQEKGNGRDPDHD